jgi:hypothetical protein
MLRCFQCVLGRQVRSITFQAKQEPDKGDRKVHQGIEVWDYVSPRISEVLVHNLMLCVDTLAGSDESLVCYQKLFFLYSS